MGASSALGPSAKSAVGGVSMTGTGMWNEDWEDPALRQVADKLQLYTVLSCTPIVVSNSLQRATFDVGQRSCSCTSVWRYLT